MPYLCKNERDCDGNMKHTLRIYTMIYDKETQTTQTLFLEVKKKTGMQTTPYNTDMPGLPGQLFFLFLICFLFTLLETYILCHG